MAPVERIVLCFVLITGLLCLTLNSVFGASQALPNVMPFKNVEYSSPKVNNTYQSTTRFDPRGMGNLYNFTKIFMKAILRDEPYPKGMFVVDDHFPSPVLLLFLEWHTIVTHYGGILGVVLLGLLFAAILPIAGLLFCCCRCTGRCGARSQPFDKRHDTCRRYCLGIMLAVIDIAILFAVVCAFATNEFMDKGVRELPDKANVVLNDTHLFIQNTKKEVNSLLVTNYGELSETLTDVLENSGQTLKDQLAEISHAVALDNLTKIVDGLDDIKSDLTEVNNLTVTVQKKARVIVAGLKKTQHSLNDVLEKCQGIPSCRKKLEPHAEEISKIKLDENFSQLPDISDSLNNMSGLVGNGIREDLLKGKQGLQRIQEGIQQGINHLIPVISQSIVETGRAIREKAIEINGVLDKADQVITEVTYFPMRDGKMWLNQYSPYRYHLDLTVCCVLLLILAPISFGLFCGFCGKRPDAGYGDDCCNRGAGARLLMISVWVILLTSSAMIFVVLAHFILGVFGDRAVCEPLRHPQDNQLFALVDQLKLIDKLYEANGLGKEQSPQQNLSSLITSCHQNHSIYTVLNLESRVNMAQVLTYVDRFHFKERLAEIENQLSIDGRITILTPEARKKLLALASSSLSNIDFDIYTQVLNHSFTELNLTVLAKTLNEVAKQISSKEIALQLEVDANSLMHYQQDIERLTADAQQLNNSVLQLKEHLKLNQSSLPEAVMRLLNEVTEAERYLNEEGPQELIRLARKFAADFIAHVVSYLNRVVNHTQTEVGKCWPLSQVYNATLTATCDEILKPFNGFWASVGWCLLLFLPSIILSVKLSTLYQKSDPYPGPLVESEYMYDAYAERDNIPLANVHDNKKRKKTKQSRGRSYQEAYDNSGGGGYMSDYSAHLGRGGGGDRARPRPGPDAERVGHSQSGQRYSDMAPKHWDFPNNGPPRYHSPHTPHSPPMSTEYERPPPYYFPGPGEGRS